MEKAPFPNPVRKLIARFYELVDILNSESDRKLAAEVFAPDGKFIINLREMNGTQGKRVQTTTIHKCLLTRAVEIERWAAVSEDVLSERRHDVLDTYACGGNHFITTGTLTLATKAGKEASAPYCARCVVDDANSSNPRIKLWQGWLVS